MHMLFFGRLARPEDDGEVSISTRKINRYYPAEICSGASVLVSVPHRYSCTRRHSGERVSRGHTKHYPRNRSFRTAMFDFDRIIRLSQSLQTFCD